MKRHIWLEDLAHLPTPRQEQLDACFGAARVEHARNVLAAEGLRYDNATGIVRISGRLYGRYSGELERPSNPADHVPCRSHEEVMRWVFSRYIANGASRMMRGYSVT